MKALGLKERLLGREHPDVAVTLNNLGVLYRAQKRFLDAQLCYRRAYAIFSNTFYPEHPSVQTCASNLARLTETIQ